MTKNPAKFDAIKYKQTTLDQWNNAAEAWHRWTPFLSRWLGPGTETMLDMCHVNKGHRALDVAAGAGEQTVTIAKRVGESGHVLATDISPNILEYARISARLTGLQNVHTRVMDGENLTALEAQPFDVAISRVGLIYFPNQHKALTGMRHQLKNGGKVAAMVYSSAENNPFFSIPVSMLTPPYKFARPFTRATRTFQPGG